MASPTDGGAGAFYETRRALLDALEHGEQQLRDQAAEIVRRAEERARQISAEAEARAAELEQQLASLQQEIGDARARLAAVRVRGGAPAPISPRVHDEPRAAPVVVPAPAAVAATAPPAESPAPRGGRKAEEPEKPAAEAQEGTGSEAPSPRETLRALRSALENSQNRSG